MIFNEDELFDGNLDRMKDDCLHIDLSDLAQLLISLHTLEEEVDASSNSNLNDISVGNLGVLDEAIYDPVNEHESENQGLTELAEEAIELMQQDSSESSSNGDHVLKDQIPEYPTPPQTPPAALLAASIQGPEGLEDSEPIEAFTSRNAVWKAAFTAGRMSQQVS